MRRRYKAAIFMLFQPFLFMFDRFLYTYLYLNGFSFIQIALAEVMFAIVALISMFVIGNYPDIKGKRKIIPLMMGYYSIFPLIYVRLRTFFSVLITRLLDGLRYSYIPLYYNVLQDMSPKKKKGRYFGIMMAIVGLSSVFVYLLAGTIVEFWGFGLLAAVTSGFILSFSIFFFFNFREDVGKSKEKHRKLSFRVIKNKFVVAYSVYQMIIIYVFITNWAYLPIKSYDVTSSFVGVGLILFAGQIMFTMGQIPFGMLADKVGMMKIYITGMILSSITSFFLGFFREGFLMIIVNFMAGFAINLTTPAEQALVDKNIPESRRAEFNNVIHIMKEIGVIITVILATAMIILFNIDYVFYLQSIVFLIAPIAFFITYKVAKEN